VLADGAEMPTPEQLPPSIAALAGHNAFRLSWHEEVGRIGRQVAQVERERAAREAAEIAERERLDLTRGGRVKAGTWRSQTAAASFNVAISAMELSLERQGRHVRLAPADFWKSMEKVTGHPLDQGFMLADLVYVVDFVGIKARRVDRLLHARIRSSLAGRGAACARPTGADRCADHAGLVRGAGVDDGPHRRSLADLRNARGSVLLPS
jgi:hypothetical protein